MSQPEPPALFSVLRIGSLLASLIVALGSGSNYAFSAYGPQLASRLKLSHTRLNVIGIAGTVGVYGMAPPMGKLVDMKGPRPLLVIAFFSLFTGYYGIRYFYVRGLPEGLTELSNSIFFALMLCGFLTGIGGNGGIMSAMNATAKSFPDRARATVTGLVLSMFGLSAFVFSTTGHTIFPGDTASLLLTLAIGTSIPMIIGFFFMRPIPLPSSEYEEIHTNTHTRSHTRTPTSVREGQDITSPLLAHPELPSPTQGEDDADVSSASTKARDSAVSEYVVGTPYGTPLHQMPSRVSVSTSEDSSTTKEVEDTGIRGLALAASVDFWLLFVITVLLSGTGLMYINNVGLMSQALYAYDTDSYDETDAAKWQARQVAILSVFNCLGRILMGLLADSCRHLLSTPRSTFISVCALLFFISQLTALAIDDVQHLWQASAILGLSYGSLFGLFPTVTIEWFGLHHFSENWGFLSLAPVIGSNIFSLAFGSIIDSHTDASDPERNQTPHTHSTITSNSVSDLMRRLIPELDHSICLKGRACYADSLKVTIGACALALVLAVIAGIKDWRKIKRIRLIAEENARREREEGAEEWEDV